MCLACPKLHTNNWVENFPLTLEGPSASIDAFKFLHADKSRFLKYYRFVHFDFDQISCPRDQIL